jgi:hypothetical protein
MDRRAARNIELPVHGLVEGFGEVTFPAGRDHPGSLTKSGNHHDVILR